MFKGNPIISTPIAPFFSTLFFINLQADGETSIPIHFLSFLCATANVVPQPQKESKTKSSLFEETFIIRSSNATGF